MCLHTLFIEGCAARAFYLLFKKSRIPWVTFEVRQLWLLLIYTAAAVGYWLLINLVSLLSWRLFSTEQTTEL
jgi:hypothetical protein